MRERTFLRTGWVDGFNNFEFDKSEYGNAYEITGSRLITRLMELVPEKKCETYVPLNELIQIPQDIQVEYRLVMGDECRKVNIVGISPQDWKIYVSYRKDGATRSQILSKDSLLRVAVLYDQVGALRRQWDLEKQIEKIPMEKMPVL